MSLKKPYTIKTLQPEEATQVNINFDRLYSTRIEAIKHRDLTASAGINKSYQSIETGIFSVSANDSAVIVKSLPLMDSYKDILYANGNALHSSIEVRVTDITQSGISFDIIATAVFSDITTATVKINYLIVGSSP